ncbi:hypothetical protein R3P38DRAFT_3232170 [Favolaschia claudopus]|uniref:CCHC-type domain-containing protein n=1 Tax=Favolaschia claudopus TaxID=2862362 RepID=A0AAV9ZIB0_9AGAR
MEEVSDAAEWYFRRNRPEAMIINAADYDLEFDAGYYEVSSGGESEETDDEDFESYRKHKREKAKTKKEREKRRKEMAERGTSKDDTESISKPKGSTEEISGLIRQLNKMTLDDPEYTPVYYTLLAKDTTGQAAKWVKPPEVLNNWARTPRVPRSSPLPPRNSVNMANNNNNSAATYPNNIPLGSSSNNIGPSNAPQACFGCGAEGHRIGECPEISELIREGIIKQDDETRRIKMADGSNVRRAMGEPIAAAVRRLQGPRVMFGILDSEVPGILRQEEYFTEEEDELDEQYASYFYNEHYSGHLETLTESSDDSELSLDTPEDSDSSKEVYLSIPKRRHRKEGIVNAADRTVPSTRTARQQVFDGVHVPRRDKINSNRPPPAGERLNTLKPTKSTSNQTREILADVKPYDARMPRQPKDQDVEMRESSVLPNPKASKENQKEVRVSEKSTNQKNESVPRITESKGIQREALRDSPNNAAKVESKEDRPIGRQSDLQATVNLPSIVERILDLQIPFTVREALVASKDLRNGIQESMRLKNAKAVLMGAGAQALTRWNWPRSEGVLIKIELDIGGRGVTAIVDTGSQLDVVRADVAALVLRRPVDMTKSTGMNDANGGRGELRGFIHNVELNCGNIPTRTGLWVAQQAPFELLLGRPWQRNNFVSIDEREEGTYLIFRDPNTRQACHELLAVPSEATNEIFEVTTDPHTVLLGTEDPAQFYSSKRKSTYPDAFSSPLWTHREYNQAGIQCKEILPVNETVGGSHSNRFPGSLLTIAEQVGTEYHADEVSPLTCRGKLKEPDPETNSFSTPELTRQMNENVPEWRALLKEVVNLLRLWVNILSLFSGRILLKQRERLQKAIRKAFKRSAETTLSERNNHPLHSPINPLNNPTYNTQSSMPNYSDPRANNAHDPGPRRAQEEGFDLVAALNKRITEIENTQTPAVPELVQIGFGKTDRELTGTLRHLTRVLTWSQRDEYRTGRPPHVRPSTTESNQTFNLGKTTHGDGQEILRLFMLNARMLVLDPDTGLPGERTGHALIQLVAKPTDDSPWAYNVPLVSNQRVHQYCEEILSTADKRRVRVPTFERITSNQNQGNENKENGLEEIHTSPFFEFPRKRPPPILTIPVTDDRPTHYLMHPPGHIPPPSAQQLPQIGLTKDHAYVVRESRGTRPPTPSFPMILLMQRPPLADEPSRGGRNTMAMGEGEDQGTRSLTSAPLAAAKRPTVTNDRAATPKRILTDHGHPLYDSPEPLFTADFTSSPGTPPNNTSSSPDIPPYDRQLSLPDSLPELETARQLWLTSCLNNNNCPQVSASSEDDSLIQTDVEPQEILDIALQMLLHDPAMDTDRFGSPPPLKRAKISFPAKSPSFPHIIIISDSSDDESDHPPTYLPTPPYSPAPATHGGSNADDFMDNADNAVLVHQDHLLQMMQRLRITAPTPTIEARHLSPDWSRICPRLEKGVKEQLDVDSAENQSVLQDLRVALVLLNGPLREFVRVVSQQHNSYTGNYDRQQQDLINRLQADIQNDEDRVALEAVAMRYDDQRFQVPFDIPPPATPRYHRERAFSSHALWKGEDYRAVLAAEAQLNPFLLSLLTDVRLLVLKFMNQVLELLMRRHWFVEAKMLGKSTTPPLPFLHESEFYLFRLVYDTLSSHQQTDIVRTIDQLLDVDFKNREVIRHFLHSGLLDVKTSDVDSTKDTDGRGMDNSGVTVETDLQARISVFNFSFPFFRTNTEPEVQHTIFPNPDIQDRTNAEPANGHVQNTIVRGRGRVGRTPLRPPPTPRPHSVPARGDRRRNAPRRRVRRPRNTRTNSVAPPIAAEENAFRHSSGSILVNVANRCENLLRLV